MPTPISLQLKVDRDSIQADMTQVFDGLGRTIDNSLRVVVTSLDRITNQIKEMGQVFAQVMGGSIQLQVQQFEKMSQMIERMTGGMQSFANQSVRGANEARDAWMAAISSADQFDRNRMLRNSYVADRAGMLTGANQTDIAAGAYRPRDPALESSVASLVSIIQRQAEREQANREYLISASGRRGELAAYGEEAYYGGRRNASFTEAAINRYTGGRDKGLEGQVSALWDSIERSVAIAEEKTRALEAAAGRRSELAGYASDARVQALRNSSFTEAAINRYSGPRGTSDLDGMLDALMGNIESQGRSQGNASVLSFLRGNGYRLNSTSIGPDGNPTSQSYSRSAGFFRNAESATHDMATGELRRQIQENTNLAHRMWAAIAGEGSPMSQGLNAALAPLNAIHAVAGKIVGVFHTIGNEAIRISALFYSVRRISEGLGSAFLGPIEYVMNSAAKGREFESSIAGLAGTGGAQSIDRQLVGAMNNSPFTLDETRNQFTQFSKIAPFAQAIASGGGMAQFQQYQNVLAGLQVLNPGADADTITQGLGGAFLGQGRSLRGIVRIDPDQLAELVGKGGGQRAFRDNPELLLSALQKYIQMYAAPGAVAGRQNLASVQIGHIQGTFEDAMGTIGNSGIFDAVVAQLKKVADGMFEYVQSPEFTAKAEQISGYLTVILGNISQAIQSFVSGVTGKDVKKGADGMAEGVANLVGRLAEASNQLPAVAYAAGYALNFLASNVADFADFIIRMTDRLSSNHPMDEQQRAQALSNRLAENGYGADQQSVQQVRIPRPDGVFLGAMGANVAEADKYETHYAVGVGGQNSAILHKAIERALGTQNDNGSVTGGISDTALRDPVFFRYMMRDILGTPGLPGSTLFQRRMSGGFGNQTAADLLSSNISRTKAQLSFDSAGQEKDPQLQALMFQAAMPNIWNLAPGDQFEALDRVTKSRLGAARQLAGAGPQYDSIAGLLAGRSSGGGAEVAALQDSLRYAQQIASTRQQDALAHPDDEAKQNQFKAAAADVTILTAELQKAQAQTSLLENTFIKFGNSAQNTLENGLGRALTELETKGKNVQQVFAELAKSILNEFNQDMIHAAFGSILGTPNGQPGIGNGIGGGFGAVTSWLTHLFTPTAFTPQVTASAGASDAAISTPMTADIATAADGGLFIGGLRFLASGGVVKGGKGQLAVIGEGGLGADEAVVPLRNGYLPIGHSEAGPHAVLPGGRSIPAAYFADGGVTGGGSGVATMGATAGWSSGAVGGGRFGSSGDVNHTTVVQLDGKTIASHTVNLTRPMMKGQIMRAMGPGGDGRRAASRT